MGGGEGIELTRREREEVIRRRRREVGREEREGRDRKVRDIYEIFSNSGTRFGIDGNPGILVDIFAGQDV
eukprot:1346644-Amorphochlora_amoeboformis.AAC.1